MDSGHCFDPANYSRIALAHNYSLANYFGCNYFGAAHSSGYYWAVVHSLVAIAAAVNVVQKVFFLEPRTFTFCLLFHQSSYRLIEGLIGLAAD